MRLAPVIALLTVIRVKNNDIYLKLKNKQINYQQLKKSLDLPEVIPDNEEGRKMSRLLEWIMFCLFSDEECANSDVKAAFDRMGQSLFRYDIERNEIIPLYCKFLDMFKAN